MRTVRAQRGSAARTGARSGAAVEPVRWVRGLLYEEIVPTIAYRVDDVALFADQTWDRLRNPFLSHRLSDIAMYHADKVRIRLQPTREEYEKLFGKPPLRLTEVLRGP